MLPLAMAIPFPSILNNYDECYLNFNTTTTLFSLQICSLFNLYLITSEELAGYLILAYYQNGFTDQELNSEMKTPVV
jgi:hypothetical protein